MSCSRLWFGRKSVNQKPDLYKCARIRVRFSASCPTNEMFSCDSFCSCAEPEGLLTIRAMFLKEYGSKMRSRRSGPCRSGLKWVMAMNKVRLEVVEELWWL